MFVPKAAFSLFSLLLSAFIHGIREKLSSFEIKDIQTWISKPISTKQYNNTFFDPSGKHQKFVLTGSVDALPFSCGVGVAVV